MNTRILLPALGFALVWVVAAIISPSTTFHLAPAIVAAIPPLRDPVRRPAPALAGVALALLVSVVLAATGRLDGPSLLPVGGALLESVLSAIAGAAIGMVFAGRLAVDRPEA